MDVLLFYGILYRRILNWYAALLRRLGSGVRRVWSLPNQTHCALITLTSGRPYLYDELVEQMLFFIPISYSTL